MRVAPSLTLPKEILKAQRDGELVVFAGAGVSMGPPSLLPSFEALAKEIAEPTVPMLENDADALDQYLSRAEKAGVQVQDRALEKLSLRLGGHTPLHEHLLRVFGSSDQVRLITTNFDPHFINAASTVFPAEPIPGYCGPALPPGRGFRGLVHLHGSVRRAYDGLVLTLRDFAAAYMTEGWATRFLMGVFAERTVLFVGYRLGDPVMKYLLGGLLPTNRWYVLVHEDETRNWAGQNVVPVPFSTRSDGEKFGDLNDGLARWAWFTSASPSERDLELRRLIASGTPSSDEDSDFIRECLELPLGRVTFWSTATAPGWFLWAAEQKLLESLIDGNAADSNGVYWSRWALTNYCSGLRPDLTEFFRRRSLTVSRIFARELAQHLGLQASLPDRNITRQLIALLVNRPRAADEDAFGGEWLFKKLVAAGYSQEALAVLRWMTAVRLKPKEPIYFALERDDDGAAATMPSLSTTAVLHIDSDDARRALADSGAALAAVAAAEMVDIGIQRIADVYDLVYLAGGASEEFDWPSYSRTAIEPSDQDRVAGSEDVLVELIRIALDHWKGSAPELLLQFAERFHRDNRRLLKRLALYALTNQTLRTSDELLDQAGRERWASDLWIRQSLYSLLAAHFPLASEEARARLIGVVDDSAHWVEMGENDGHTKFSLSQFLHRLAPDSAAAIGFSARQRVEHPDWSESGHSGYLSRVTTSWGSDTPSPVSATELIGLSAPEALTMLQAALSELAASDEPRSFASEPLKGALREAVKASPAWALELLTEIRTTENASVFGDAILWGMFDATSSVETQLALLRIVADWDWPDEVTRPLSALMDHWARAIKRDASVDLLDLLDVVADKVYSRASDAASALTGDQSWTDRAINHPGGHAASTWWMVANARDWTGETFALSIDDPERRRWEQVLSGRTVAAAYARVFLGMASDRYSTGDPAWSEQHLFPAFSPERDTDVCAPLWDGRFGQPQWSWATVVGLRPYMLALFSASETLLPARGGQLGGWVALLVTHPANSQFTLLDLQHFVQHVGQASRASFAQEIPEQLDRLDGTARLQLWADMLRPYWRDRRTNVPLGFEPAEVVSMVGWVVALPEVASEALAELEQTSGQSLPHADRVIWNWRGDDTWVRAHPAEAAAIIGWLARRRSVDPWVADEAVTFLEAALENGAPRRAIIEAGEALAQLPCLAAVDLLARLRADSPPMNPGDSGSA